MIYPAEAVAGRKEVLRMFVFDLPENILELSIEECNRKIIEFFIKEKYPSAVFFERRGMTFTGDYTRWAAYDAHKKLIGHAYFGEIWEAFHETPEKYPKTKEIWRTTVKKELEKQKADRLCYLHTLVAMKRDDIDFAIEATVADINEIERKMGNRSKSLEHYLSLPA